MMKAWRLHGVSDLNKDSQPLKAAELPIPDPGTGEILIRIVCCGICHTELDEIEGRTTPLYYPVIPGHQVIGYVHKLGQEANRFAIGDRVGVTWIYSACGTCEYCLRGLENLCPEFRATGRDANGGYAEYMVVHENFAYAIPDVFSDAEAAPLLCAGAIGYRSLKLAGLQDGDTLGLTGFGASGHLVLQMAKHLYPSSRIVVFARSPEEQAFARSLGAYWAGNTSDTPPFPAHAIIDTTPVWTPVLAALRHLKPGGRLVINVIRKEPTDRHVLLELRYTDHLWMEKEVKSVANLTRDDVSAFLKLAAAIPIRPEIVQYPFKLANQAMIDLKRKNKKGAKVLVME